MARKAIVEVQCERCTRKETQELGPGDNNGQLAEPPPVFFGRVQILGEKPLEAKFGDLCGPCARTVKALFEQIAKKVEGLSPDRTAKKESKDAPVETQPSAGGATEAKPDPKATKKDEPASPAPAPPRQAAAKVPAAGRSS